MLENTARDPLARAKRVAVDNGKYKKKTGENRWRKRACESASQSAQDSSQMRGHKLELPEVGSRYG